jgi:alpha-L-fucosidase
VNRRDFSKLWTFALPGLALGKVVAGAHARDSEAELVPIAPGPFKPTFESLKQYETPEWFIDAKLGIFLHWGPCAVGGTHGWYGREMYRQGSETYRFHVSHFGHPSRFGYKDICSLFTAEKFDAVQADALVKLYKQAGARYVVPVAVHHDNFDMWDSRYQPRWNAKVASGKDIIGMWKKATEANDLRFGVSSHVARTYRWFQTSHQADKEGPLKGVPYDGADPQYSDLYGVPWKVADPTFAAWSIDCDYEQYRDVGPPEWERQFERRMRDLLDRYEPDFYYTDGGIPFHVHPSGLNILAHFYNSSIARHGKLEAVAAIKLDWQPNDAVLDFEGATKGGIPDYYWQSDKAVNREWYWMRWEKPEEYISVKRVIATLMDNISRNGCLLLNLPLKPDGTFDPAVVQMLEEMGQCTRNIGEAIFATRPWEVFGEGPTDFSENFLAGTARDIRFARNKANTVLYATALDWPGDGATLTITTLKAGRFDAGAISSVTLLQNPGKLVWKQDEAGLKVTLPASAPGVDIYTLKIIFKTRAIPKLQEIR